jgi:hypothetical protein
MHPNQDNHSYKLLRRWFVAAVLFALPSLAVGWLFILYVSQTIQIAWGDEQTAIFEEMRDKSLRANNSSDAAGYLEDAVNYYASGTKQKTGSRLDEIVERQRRCEIRDMIAARRRQTGQDLGEDPGAWIAKLRKAN